MNPPGIIKDLQFSLKEIRKAMRLTQEEFGKLIGVSRVQYNYYENGDRDLKGKYEIIIINHLILNLISKNKLIEDIKKYVSEA